MENKINHNLQNKYVWVQKNSGKILTLFLFHITVSSIFSLPYFNLVNILFQFLPFILDWFAILLLFRPKKELILKIVLILFILSIPFAAVHAKYIAEVLGDLNYLLLITYIVISLKEIRRS